MNNHRKYTFDYYALLGIPVDASPGQIKSAYRNLVKRYHPDIYGFDDLIKRRKAELTMRQINEAYAVLSDSKKRQSYDDDYVTSPINSPTSPVASSVIFAGWIWSILVDHYHIISSMWNLCWWFTLIAVACGLLAYL